MPSRGCWHPSTSLPAIFMASHDPRRQEVCCDVLVRHVFLLQGIPKNIVLDRGPQFTSHYIYIVEFLLHAPTALLWVSLAVQRPDGRYIPAPPPFNYQEEETAAPSVWVPLGCCQRVWCGTCLSSPLIPLLSDTVKLAQSSCTSLPSWQRVWLPERDLPQMESRKLAVCGPLQGGLHDQGSQCP